eukprot:gene4559-2556_t
MSARTDDCEPGNVEHNVCPDKRVHVWAIHTEAELAAQGPRHAKAIADLERAHQRAITDLREEVDQMRRALQDAEDEHSALQHKLRRENEALRQENAALKSQLRTTEGQVSAAQDALARAEAASEEATRRHKQEMAEMRKQMKLRLAEAEGAAEREREELLDRMRRAEEELGSPQRARVISDLRGQLKDLHRQLAEAEDAKQELCGELDEMGPSNHPQSSISN